MGTMPLWASTNEHVDLSGDARNDSPGYSAKYRTYTVMEMETDTILDFELVQVSETDNNSVIMEKVGLERILKRLDENDINIKTLATDRSPTIKTFLKKKTQLFHINLTFGILPNLSLKNSTKRAKKGRWIHCESGSHPLLITSGGQLLHVVEMQIYSGRNGRQLPTT